MLARRPKRDPADDEIGKGFRGERGNEKKRL